MSGQGALPATFAVKTREGTRGLLQILGFTDSPRRVKVRYKLVQLGATVPEPSSANSNQLAFAQPPAQSSTDATRATLVARGGMGMRGGFPHEINLRRG
jgi:hypothetical protein